MRGCAIALMLGCMLEHVDRCCGLDASTSSWAGEPALVQFHRVPSQ